MEVKEFDDNLHSVFINECNQIKEQNSSDNSNDESVTELGTKLQEVLFNFQNYKNVSNLTSKQMNNIRASFSTIDRFGAMIGFIDTALMFNNGKTGVLFQQCGISVKNLGSSVDNSISFRDLCRGKIEQNSDYLLPGYKFNIQNSSVGIPLIKAAGKMDEMLKKIRDFLLKNNSQARSVFYKSYSHVVGSIIDADNTDDAIELTKFLFELCQSFPVENYYKIPGQLMVLLELSKHNFDQAIAYAEKNSLDEWKEFAVKKRSEYKEILFEEYLSNALSSFEKEEYETAETNVLKALEEKSTQEAWQLYLDIIINSANDANAYNQEKLRELVEDADKEPEQEEVLRVNSDKILNLNRMIEEYNKNLCTLIPEKVRENDISFFEKNKQYLIEHVDENNMNALMYAAFYHKNDLLKLLISQGYNTSLNAFETFSICELYSLLGNGIDEYNKYVGKYDPEWMKLKKLLDDETKKAKSDMTKANVHGAVSGYADLIVASSDFIANFYGDGLTGVSIAHDISSGAAANATEKMKDAKSSYDAMVKLAKEYSDNYFADFYKSNWLKIVDIIGSPDEVLSKIYPDISDEANVDDYKEAIGELYEVFESEVLIPLVKEKLREKNLEKDEFETTEQFNTRFNNEKEKTIRECLKPAYDRFKQMMEFVWKSTPKIRNLVGTLFEQCGNVKVGAYDADNQRFPLEWNGFIRPTKFYLDVPIDQARAFKSSFGENGIPVKVADYSNEGLSAICGAEVDDEIYVFELRQSNEYPEFKDKVIKKSSD